MIYLFACYQFEYVNKVKTVFSSEFDFLGQRNVKRKRQSESRSCGLDRAETIMAERGDGDEGILQTGRGEIGIM